MAIEQVDATSIVNQELDKICAAKGVEYTQVVSAAFASTQVMQFVALMRAITEGVKLESGHTADDLVNSIASTMSFILGITSYKLDDAQRDEAMQEVERIQEIVYAAIVVRHSTVH